MTGTAAVGPSVVNMQMAYHNCRNLTTAACGPNVIDMSSAYYNCTNLTGPAACGNNVAYMSYAYYNCINLTGAGIIGSNVTDASYAYSCCDNISNVYIYSSKLSDVRGVVSKSNYDRRTNLYVLKDSQSLTKCLSTDKTVVLNSITWTQSGEMYYNTVYNVYIYPVANVAQQYEQNENKTSYTVTNVSTNGGYGFTLADDGYYENTNMNVDNSFAICRVDFENPKGLPIRIYIEQDTEIHFDYGIVSKINTAFSDYHVFDSDYYASCEDATTADIGYGNYTSGYFYIKYIKDSSVSKGTDKFRFKIVFLGEEDLDKGASWDVERLSGVDYGFSLNSNEYWQSENKGIDYSAALCKVVIDNPNGYEVFFDCINYAESNYDFGILSKVGATLDSTYN